MPKRVFNMVYREVRGLHQAAYVLALFTFGSQLLALIRDRLLAHEFGAGIELDLYYAAFRIPDLLYVLFASTLSVYVLIPFISKRIEENSVERGKALLSQIFSLFLIAYIGVAIIAVVFAPTIVAWLFPGFVEHADTLTLLIRVLIIQPLLLGMSSLYGIITQIEYRFILYAVSPLLYNLGIIGGLLFLYPHFGILGLVYGVLVGALGHMLVQLPCVMKNPLAPKFTLNFHSGEILEVCRASFGRAITLTLHQVVLITLIGFASIMTVGSVSVFQFAFNLQSVPLAIIGMSYSVAAFPLLSKLFAEKDFTSFGSNISTALRHVFFWSLPAIALFIVIRAQFVRTVLGSGSFDWNDTRLTAAVLAVFVLSLTAQAVHLLLVRTLYAVGNTLLPFFVTLFSSFLAILFSFFFHMLFLAQGAFYTFMQTMMRLEGVTGIEVLALPLGYSCALIIHSIILIILGRRHIFVSVRNLIKPFLQSFISALCAGLASYATLNYFVTTITADTLITIFSQGLLAAICGIAVYMFVQHTLRNTELREMYRALGKRFTKEDVLVPQDEDHLLV